MKPRHWLTEGIIYEVFVREYSDAGTLAEVAARLDEIGDLGVTTVWLMPIHPVGELRKKGTLGSPYAVRDYGRINPDFGAEADLRDLVDRAHERGMRLIIDWVINHSAWDNPLTRTNPELYQRDEAGNIKVAGHGWTDTAQLDHSSPGLREHLIRQMLRWVRELDIDGFRCDVAGLVPVGFWEDAVQALTQVRPDLGMLAEAYNPELMERAFQLTYDGPWFRAVTRKLLRGGGSERMWDKHDMFTRRFPAHAEPMRYIDNHDQPRLVPSFGLDASLAAATLLLTSEGVPLVYNGQEIGSEVPSAAPALFERNPIDWTRPKPGFRQHYRELIHLRRSRPALERGDTAEIEVPHRQLVAFTRRHGDETIFVAISASPDPIRCELRDPRLRAATTLLHERRSGRGTRFSDGGCEIELGAWGWVVCGMA